jgi:hypothetical protein
VLRNALSLAIEDTLKRRDDFAAHVQTGATNLPPAAANKRLQNYQDIIDKTRALKALLAEGACLMLDFDACDIDDEVRKLLRKLTG